VRKAKTLPAKGGPGRQGMEQLAKWLKLKTYPISRKMLSEVRMPFVSTVFEHVRQRARGFFSDICVGI
jgi:hypothetical protein